MQNLLHDGLLRGTNIEGKDEWRETKITLESKRTVPSVSRLSSFMGEEHLMGFLYGVVNWIVCVPGLVSYAHIVFMQDEFKPYMPQLVKLYFLSSAVMQLAMSVRSTITFSIGQIQDVGLIFLAGMVRNIVQWAKEEGFSNEEVLTTSLWQSASSTFVVGVCLVVIGRLQLSQYVQLLPLPVIGGYLGYIGYFCLAAGLSIGSGLEINEPSTLLLLLDAGLRDRMLQLVVMTGVMLFVHFKVKHFLAMPAILLLLPIAFFAVVACLGISLEECRSKGWLAQPEPAASGLTVFQLFDTTKVQWQMLPRQFINVCGLVIIVSFGSSLDIAAIQAEMAGQKLDYNRELVTIGFGNLASGLVGGATGSYIFSQTIFSAKRGVRSRWNGLVVCVGELVLFLLPFDVVQWLPNSYIGGTMCLFGVDIMGDWLVQSRALMAPTEYILLWLSFACVMWLTASHPFGVLEGMAIGTIGASLTFVWQYAHLGDHWQAVTSRSSVVRPPRERRVLTAAYRSILAVSLKSFAFFGASMHIAQGIEAEATRCAARFVCLDMGLLSGLDSTACDQLRLLVLALERNGVKVLMSSLRSATAKRLLRAHGVVTADRIVFNTLDQALQYCEEQLLQSKPCRGEQPLDSLLLDYVDGFVSTRQLAAAAAAAATGLCAHFKRLQLGPEETLFRQEEPAEAIFVVAAGSVRVSSHREWTANVATGLLPSPTDLPVTVLARSTSRDSSDPAPVPLSVDQCNRELDMDDTAEHVGVGGILGDTAFFARRRCGCDAVAEGAGCVVHAITREKMEKLELTEPALVVFLQKVLLRDLSQLQVQFIGPLHLAGGLT